jgi:hypothetical protein
MSDPFADTTLRLQQLVEEVMKSTDSAKYDELCGEIWRVLRKRDGIREAPKRHGR